MQWRHTELLSKLNTSDAAACLGSLPGTLAVWRCQGRDPAYHKLGRRVLCNVDDLEAFASAHIVYTTFLKPEDDR
ncbi:DNA-binding protein [Oceanidesulfovibrio marinus]|uniref:DNA-binding protein n=1 Tax=Oceanidesulfovibrio marinus TaxID=370038 RepID=A0A6P1ZAN2_9BACT|nr:DNA-binding protein [Oceanidesulfovibrio marinus]